MVSGDGVVKVGDLGMARDVYLTNYYRANGRGPMPIRWMAPESICDGQFTCKSDVWSYGVVLWEIATLAELPYQGLSNDEVLSHVKRGHHLPRPEICSDLLHDLMSECWQAEFSSRPTFLDVCRQVSLTRKRAIINLSRKLLPATIDAFKTNSFCCSMEGEEAKLREDQM